MVMAPEEEEETHSRNSPQTRIPPLVEEWLRATYTYGEGYIKRADMYMQYRTFCNSIELTPQDAACFGKIVKVVFPSVGYRRLGPRQHTEAHYSNLAKRNGDPSEATHAQRKPPKTRKKSQRQDPKQLGGAVQKGQRGRRQHRVPERSHDCHKRRTPDLVLVDNRHIPLENTLIIRTYRDMYKHEMWGLVPTNPATLKLHLISYILFAPEGQSERSALSFNCLATLSVGSFLNGNWLNSRQWFNMAREHLFSMTKEQMNYDVAAGLVTFCWWIPFYAENIQEGKAAQKELINIGIEICKSLGAINDQVYHLLINLKAHNFSQKKIEEIEATKKLTRFKRPWKEFKEFKRPASMDWAGMFQECTLMFQRVRFSASRNEIIELLDKLGKFKDLVGAMEAGLRKRPTKQIYNMLATFSYALSAILYSMLPSSPNAAKCAIEVFKFLMSIEKPMMLISLHSLFQNSLMILQVVDILIDTCQFTILSQFLKHVNNLEKLKWLMDVTTHITLRMQDKMMENVTVQPIPIVLAPP